MADNQEELRQLYESGVSDRQMEAAKARNKADYELLMKQGMNLMRPEEKKKTALDALKDLGEGGAKAAEEYRSKKSMKKGGKVSSASKRADGIATKGKTKGRIV